MNYWVLSAGGVQLVLCGIHFFAGGAEYRRLRPGPARADAGKAFDYWLTGHGVFHMVSADLLLGAVFCLLMGAKVMGFHFWLILFIALLHAFYALFWLGTLFFSRAGWADYFQAQPQWLAFLLVCALLLAGVWMNG